MPGTVFCKKIGSKEPYGQVQKGLNIQKHGNVEFILHVAVNVLKSMSWEVCSTRKQSQVRRDTEPEVNTILGVFQEV